MRIRTSLRGFTRQWPHLLVLSCVFELGRTADDCTQSACSDQRHVTRLFPRSPARDRSRRALVYPGTLWCGAGNLASNYDELGEHTETDVCCREHDHCPHTVAAFESKYGFLNYRWYTILHCSCDYRFRQCLHKANSTASRVIGQAYFNVISVPCFTFEAKQTCAHRTWWGWCKHYQSVRVAKVQPQQPYDFGWANVIDIDALSEEQKLQQVTTPQPAHETVTDFLAEKDSNNNSLLQSEIIVRQSSNQENDVWQLSFSGKHPEKEKNSFPADHVLTDKGGLETREKGNSSKITPSVHIHQGRGRGRNRKGECRRTNRRRGKRKKKGSKHRIECIPSLHPERVQIKTAKKKSGIITRRNGRKNSKRVRKSKRGRQNTRRQKLDRNRGLLAT